MGETADGAKVWLIGGTSESAELASALAERHIPFVVTVTTAVASTLYPAETSVFVGKLTQAQMGDFVLTHTVSCVLDASHPFAQVVSTGAIALAAQSGHIAYLRYERAPISSEQGEPDNGELVSSHPSLETLLNPSQLRGQTILLTLGCHILLNYAPQLAQLRKTSKLFVRVLPSQAALSAALSTGFSAKNILALRPPISYSLEKALWQQWQISTVIAKASGQAGGEAIKRQVAAELGVHLRLLQRPPIKYPHQTHCLAEAIRFCEAHVSSLNC
ncbi:MAG: cobalt-precorrin-6A reductase [Cyanobacteria bacterium P01_D01_bin.105]